MKRKGIWRVACLLLSAILLASSTGCARIVTEGTSQGAEDKAVSEIVSQVDSTKSKAQVYSQYAMADRKVSLILEGYTDEATMMALADLLSERGMEAVFFLSGETAGEHADVAKYIADRGLSIGNYGLTGAKNMEAFSTEKIARQLYKTQQMIFTATGTYPTLVRCNGSQYTDELLTIAGLCGMDGAVEPTLYLNHTSFKEYKNALNTVRKLSRGSIISIKLGQILDENEFVSDKEDAASPAVDPTPSITDIASEQTPTGRYENIVPVVEWLLDALAEEGYDVVSLENLEASQMTLSEEPAELDEATLSALDIANYTVPVTEEPFGLQETEEADSTYFANTVFVGDSVTAKLKSYVEKMRLTDPSFMEGAQFLTSVGLSVGNALWEVSGDSRHPTYNGEKMSIENAIAEMDVDRVYIMLGINDAAQTDVAAYIQNYMTLIYLIRSQSPDVEIVIQSITPGIADRADPPTNQKIFEYDLALARFCLEYGFSYVDIAYALRDSQGNLPDSYCSDPDTMGLHFTDAACDIWVQYLRAHTG